MSTDKALQQQPAPPKRSRETDPNVVQGRASDPNLNVWVGASAGTGKTKVLTDRVLRLLLPRDDGTTGTDPHRILCLTFTKAAASEMALRINEKLGEWAIMSDDKLREKLQRLMHRTPTAEDMTTARRLFASVVDTPGGLKIMTIHSFCQSVLSRFPLEAGISPHFQVMDDGQAREILESAADQILLQARQGQDENSDLSDALKRLALSLNEQDFSQLIKQLCAETQQLRDLQKNEKDIKAAIWKVLGLQPSDTKQDMQSLLCEGANEAALRDVCRIVAEHGTAKETEKGIALQTWLDSDINTRIEMFDDYKSIFLTQKETIQARLLTKACIEASPAALDTMHAEAERILNGIDKIRSLETAQQSYDAMLIGLEIMIRYETAKKAQGLMDYNDLIIKTKDLLKTKDMSPWVLYKLDGGIDHVLIDEAQDTNPEQWEIIANLCDDFFSGIGQNDRNDRTIFTVGDEKQSIYSFQRAAPEEFSRMRDEFAAKIAQAERAFSQESMDISFRSTPTVLELVDAVFDDPHVSKGLGLDPVTHQSWRRGQEGSTTLWPVISPPKTEETATPWAPPVTREETHTPPHIMAGHIGDTIKGWLDDKKILESKGRPITPGDIMVLVRTRTSFVAQLVRALKTRNIPVSGIDRMVLGNELVVWDMLSLAQFALLPEDDLTLACILKSPFIGLDDQSLEDLSMGRPGSLWAQVKQHSPKVNDKDIATWLKKLIKAAPQMHPYEFFAHILHGNCPADEISGKRAIIKRLGEDALDPLEEFLNSCLSFEKNNTPDLQEFLVWIEKENLEIKREMEEAGGHVRIMTVHGSKGLQAPIVFLPDTTRGPTAKNSIDRLLWPDKTKLPVPLWTSRKDFECQIYSDARAQLASYLDEEYRRLLYVALTRAEDHLYIGGWQGGHKPIEDSWYNYISKAFDKLDHVAETSFHLGSASSGTEKEDSEEPLVSRTIHNPQTDEPKADKADENIYNIALRADIALPDWATLPAPEEKPNARPLSPSRMTQDEEEPAAQSPLAADDNYRFLRGNLTHSLLQFLPELPAESREAAAQIYIEKHGQDLKPEIRADVVHETMAILNHPDYSVIFGTGSQAEVPLTGMVGDKLLSGQIDRLLVDQAQKKIWIIDYKTNRPPPLEEKDVPEIYRNQMRSYKQALTEIYPDYNIVCLLLWTDGARLTELHNL